MLNSTYVIDGVRQEQTPAQMFSVLLADGASVPSGPVEDIVDETMEPPVIGVPSGPELSLLDSACAPDDETAIPSFPEVYGHLAVATALLDALRSGGSFKLRDLALTFDAAWDCGGVGDGAAFYSLVASVCEFADALGLQFASVSQAPSRLAGGGRHRISIGTTLLPPACTDIPEMYRSVSPHIDPASACPDTMSDDPSSWVVFVPFDTALPRLGGSRLAASLGGEFDVAPQTGDADYFIDCFEVVRELVEDGVVLAARTVGRGGLLPALDAFCGAGLSMDADLSCINGDSGQMAMLRVLYSEIPGILIQIRDLDFDYLDAELLLQEVVYYPLGHPGSQASAPHHRVSLKSDGRGGIQNILESLLRNAEGED